MRQTRKAFTMLEISVTLVVIVSLSFIAVAGISKVLAVSADTTALSSMDRALNGQRTFANAFGGYASEPSDIRGLGRDLKLVAPPTASTSADTVSMSVSTEGVLGLAVRSSSGKCHLWTVKPLIEQSTVTKNEMEGGVCLGTEALPEGAEAKEPATLR